jgi:hypothetical protein
MDPVHDIGPGREIFSQDGHKLGTVKDVTPAELKVDAPFQPDYWLSRDRILSYTNERVTMEFDHADLDRYRTLPPQDSDRSP